MKKETTQHDLLSKTRPEGFEPTTIGIGIRYSIRAELRARSADEFRYNFLHSCRTPEIVSAAMCAAGFAKGKTRRFPSQSAITDVCW